jgi:hypothetical protein
MYRNERFYGDLPPAPITAAPDLRPSGMNPAYSVYAGAYGRNLAGLGEMNIDDMNAEGIENYPNELDTLQVADDVVGNGVFDPHGSHGNIHPDQGVFQDHQSLPGYIDRDLFYAPSEVVDATSGRQVMYVPGGAVAIDEAQKRAFDDRLLWELPPGVNPWEPKNVPFDSMWRPQEASWPISGFGQPEPSGLGGKGIYIAAGVVGLAVGIFLATVMQKKKGIV